MKSYEEAIDSGRLPFERGVILSDDDFIRKALIMELMANFHIDIERFQREHNIDFFEYFREDIPNLKPFIDDGLVEISPKEIKVNETGTLLIRNIAMVFDAYMKKYAKSNKTFSKTV
jgi:oxygen-independent coproporphyrinogen-3 oxidase